MSKRCQTCDSPIDPVSGRSLYEFDVIVPLGELGAARDRAVAERDEAREWVARLLQLEIPPRNEPGGDDATKQAARERLAQWRS